MKVKCVIEEVISQEFEVDVSDINNAYDEIRNMYKDRRIVVDNPSLTQANVMIYDEDGVEPDWNDLHV